jgi:eukaryotic-like serine/threonine-protein kinase
MTPAEWRQIEKLYLAARNCSPGERVGLLESAAPDVRSRVERMLAVESGSNILEPGSDGIALDPTHTELGAGLRLGPYQIEAQVGAGGMGTVYRAIDTRLGRVVAVKVAAERYSERFQREARAISTLNHPHVCTLFDVGPNYLVMEFIEGSTLAAEIGKAALPLESVARYGSQIAGALAEAHALGIVHRDLKPSNIMITRHGVKVLDFGLAKIVSGDQADTGLTVTGGVMGTPAYMAPEQVRGKEPSSVTDLFALGLVLYEMATGHLPFPGASLGQMLSSGSHPAVPAPSRVRAGVPAGLDALIARLLEPDAAKRPQSAAEVSRELSLIVDRPTSRTRALSRFGMAAVVLFAILAAAGFLLYRGFRRPPAVARVSNNSGSNTQLTSFTDSAVWPTLSPDGRMLAFYRSDKEMFTEDQIWVKLLPNGEPVPVTRDPRQKYNIAFSPDGARIAYTVFLDTPEDTFRSYSVTSLGGDSEPMLSNSAGLSWLDDNHLLFSRIKTGVHMGIVTGRPDGSDLREIYFPAVDRRMAHYSYLSPDRKWVLLAEMDPIWHPCRVVPFSGGSLGREVGPPNAPCTSAAWSLDGKWVYLGVRVAGRRHLWRQRFPDGQPEQFTSGSAEESGIAMVPDGGSLITSIISHESALWIHDSRGERELSSEGYAAENSARFSRDGKRLYYLLRHDSPESPAELWRADLDSGKSQVILPGVSMGKFDLASDEKQVVYSVEPAGKPSEIWVAALDRSAPPSRISASGDAMPSFGAKNEVYFRLTDGKTFYAAAMAQDGSGRRRLFPAGILNLANIAPDRRHLILSLTDRHTVAYPMDGEPVQRICDGLCDVAWSPDGRYFYIQISAPSRENPTGQTVAIRIPNGVTLPPLPPEPRLPESWAKVPGAKIVERFGIAPGLDPDTYAYTKHSTHANLFRIPLH